MFYDWKDNRTPLTASATKHHFLLCVIVCSMGRVNRPVKKDLVDPVSDADEQYVPSATQSWWSLVVQVESIDEEQWTRRGRMVSRQVCVRVPCRDQICVDTFNGAMKMNMIIALTRVSINSLRWICLLRKELISLEICLSLRKQFVRKQMIDRRRIVYREDLHRKNKLA